ncbi:translocation/assembly module TamB [Pontibacter diazotrophicus]|uniref:Translocation/assembly module TamB n=1 Tax=Pontibacter diazotrophicus TaxID=1400979 RepID=A0A3D8LEQ5_9BACT|nr:translocation/assembly module TamB [Pontibacter diazotrophicus]
MEIGGFTTDWRNTLVLTEVYVEDQQQDTLWYSERLGVDMRIFSLLSGELNIGEVNLQNATAKIHIREDSTTNFDFITEAFATDTTAAQAAAQPEDTTAAAMQIDLGTVILDNVYLVFRDEAGGNFIQGRIGELETTMEELDLDAERYLVDEVELRNTAFTYEQTKIPEDTTETGPLEMDFGLNRVELENIALTYLSRVAEQRIELRLGESEVVSDNINLKDARVELESFMLHNTSVVYAQEKYKSTDSLAVNPARTARELDRSVDEANAEPMSWVMTLGELDIEDLNVKFDNFNAPEQPRGMDYDHLHFTDIKIDAEDVMYSLNRTRLDLNQLTLQEQSGFRVENFQADIVFDSTTTSLQNLDLRTGNSHLQNGMAMTYPSLDAITENPEQVALDLDINNSYIGMQDVQYFAPDLTADPSFRSIANSTIQVTAQAEGQMDNLQIQELQLVGLQGTNVDISGTVRNAMDPDNLYMDLNINRFATTRTDIQALSPPGTLPPDFRIPAQVSMTGNYTGTLTAFDANADVQTSYGNVTAVVDMDANENFTATVRSGGFDLGQLMTDSLGLGQVALEARASGNGLDPETMQATVEADVQRFDYNGYTYNDVDINANINRNVYEVQAAATDENLDFNLAGNFNLRDTANAVYAFNLDLREADLQALNLYEEPLAVQGQLQGEFTGADINTISGTLEGEELLVQYDGTDYPIDTLQLRLEQTGEIEELELKSDIADAELHFENSLATLPTALQKYFSNYFDLQPDPPYPADTNLEDFRFTLDIKRTNLITAFVPGLTQLQIDTVITGAYDAQAQELAVDGHINSIVYTDYTLRDLDLQMRGDQDALSYNLELQRLISPSLQMENITLEGAAQDDALTVRLAIAGDTTEQERFVIGGALDSEGQGYRFAFNPDQLVINGDDWDVPQDNYLQFGTDLLYANNIVLQHNNQAIALNSTGPVGPGAPLNVGFENVDIGYIMGTFQDPQDSLIAGTINGEATLEDIMSGTLSFTSDLTVTDLMFEGTSVGDIALDASSTGDDRFNINAQLTDNGNQVIVDGFVETQPNATLLNLDANIASLNMASLEGFTAGMVENMGGRANGNLSISGTLDDPDIIGQLNFDQAQFTITMLGSLYQLQDERLVFNEQGINFPDFTLTDSLGNDLTVNGNVLTQDYADYQFDLTANTDRFLALNSTAADNDLFYGTVWIAADATVGGDLAEPVLRVDVNVLDESDFTAVVPADEAGAAEREGIVEFVSLNESLTAIVGEEGAEEDTAAVTGFVGADIETQISVTDASTITIVIDPTTGDNLTVRGTADPLYVAIAPSGQINMTGRYTITDGQYSMDFYDLASRELDIAEGSYIAWTGDPMQANMQITAIYNVRTAPRELVASQTVADDPALRNQLPFQVFVNVEGEIMTPELSFDIQLPEDQRGRAGTEVVSSLESLRQDESELNKQVFALLVLGRFLAPDPLESSGGGLAASARGSLSGVMTDQLNQLTDQYAGGLGLELGVNSYEDYSSGSAQGRTDLNVALRQQFLDDRLTVRVGSDIGLEGQRQDNQTMSGFGGDISVEYSITEDGRLRVRGFQRNQYEGVLEGGDIRATGVSLIYQRDYNNFSDLFRSFEQERAREAQRRQEDEAERIKQEEDRIREEEEAEQNSTK